MGSLAGVNSINKRANILLNLVSKEFNMDQKLIC